MDQPLVSRSSLGFALAQLMAAVGASVELAARVAIMNLGTEKMYAVLVPTECRAELHHYLAERTDICMPLDGGSLLLNADQVLKVIGLAYDPQ